MLCLVADWTLDRATAVYICSKTALCHTDTFKNAAERLCTCNKLLNICHVFGCEMIIFKCEKAFRN